MSLGMLTAFAPQGASFLSKALPFLQGGAGLFGGFMADRIMKQARGDIKDLAAYNPMGGATPFGQWGFTGGNAQFYNDPISQMLRMQGGAAASGLMGGGLFNAPQLQAALEGNNMLGALQGADVANQMFIDPSMFNAVGGQAGNLAAMGFNTLQGAGNLGGLIQQNLDASRLLAEPFETNLVNRFNNQEFMRTGGATTGAFLRQSDLQDNLLRADAQRVMNAQNLGLAAQGQMGQLGMQQLGAAGDLENQSFLRSLNALGQYQTAGTQRLQNAMNLFGLGTDTFNQQFGLGLGAQQGMLDRDSMIGQLLVNFANAEANRIGATGMHAQALGQMASNRGGLLGGLLGGIFG